MTMRRIWGAALLTGAAVLLSGQSAPNSAAGRNWLTVVERGEASHRIGNPDAKVKLTEYISYTCSHCAEFAQQGGGALDLAFVSQGKVNLEVRNLLRNPIDLTAAMLVRCGPPAKFAQNHAAFLLSQAQWIGPMGNATAAQSQRWYTGPNIARRKAMASDFKFYDLMARRGYSRPEVDRCLSDEALAKSIADASAADWKRPGISGTPAFAIDGNVLVGTATWRSLEFQLAARF